MIESDNPSTISETPFLDSLNEDSAAFLKDIQQDNLKRFFEDGDLTAFHGLQTIGATQEAILHIIHMGKQLIRQNLYDKALEYFSTLSQLEPMNWQVQYYIGFIMHQKKEYALAETHYSLADAFNEEQNGVTKLYLAECLLHQNKEEMGIKRLHEAIALLQKNPRQRDFLKRAEQILLQTNIKNKKE